MKLSRYFAHITYLNKTYVKPATGIDFEPYEGSTKSEILNCIIDLQYHLPSYSSYPNWSHSFKTTDSNFVSSSTV
jgi:hypothetical protein